MAVEQSERNCNSIPANSFASPCSRPDDSSTHPVLRPSLSSPYCDGRRGSSSSGSISATKVLAPGSAPLSRMDEASQTCHPPVASTGTSSNTSSNTPQELPSTIISSCPPPRSQSPDDENSASSICSSSTSTQQSQPAASHVLDNSHEDGEPSPSFFAHSGNGEHRSFRNSAYRACNAQTASNSSGSSDRGREKDKDIGEVQVTFSEDGQIKSTRSSDEPQQGQLVPFLVSPAADPAYSATDMLLAEWNGSPFVSSYQEHTGEFHGEEDQAEETTSYGSPWHIDISKVELGEMVASGSYGMVYKGLYKDEKVAVKMLLIPEASSTKESQRLKSGFRQEIDVWYTLNHSNIVQFIGAYITPPRWAIVTEFLHGGSLRAFLVRQQRRKLPQRTIQAMALDIARGMEYLHENNIMHRDLKSANLLLDENGRVKVADFGLARFETEDPGNLTAETGTIRWMAPEVICHMPYNRKIDVYSFGVVLWELCTSQLPFEGMSFVQLAHAVANDNHRPPTSDVSSSTFTKLMTRCWDNDPSRRPDFSEIVQYLETGYSANLEPKLKPKSFSKSSRSLKGNAVDKYRRPTISMHGGRVVGSTTNTGPALLAHHDEDEATDEDEWLTVRRQCRCTIL